MTLEEKAIEFIRETKGKPKKDRPDKQIKIFYEEELKLLIGFATEVTKELKEENNKLLDVINNQDVKIADLEKENAELKHNKKTVVHLADCLEEKMKDKIAELEKKVKYYEQQLSAMEKGVCDVCKVKDADYYEKQIADLGRKNTNLRGIIKNMGACMPNCKQFRQLEQAKGIIRMVIDSYNHKERFSFEKDLAKAEQFLEGKNGITNEDRYSS